LKGNAWKRAAAIFAGIVSDPPPDLAFEICEAGVSMARTKEPGNIRFQELQPGVLSISPIHDNVVLPDELSRAVNALLPGSGSRKKYKAALILPDYSARLSVLEFDSFPEKEEDQRALVRFRLKKSVPFDIESAALSYWRQADTARKKQEVVVAVTPLEILARYEAPFRSRGIQTGFVTVSPLAALDLVTNAGISVVAKLNGSVLTIMVMQQHQLKLVRTLELAEATIEEIAADLYPTFVYVEDRFAEPAARILSCGFGALEQAAKAQFEAELQIPVESVRSPVAAISANNAGLLGYLQGVRQGTRAA
jgi:type IV pilus assembly protein PilM